MVDDIMALVDGATAKPAVARSDSAVGGEGRAPEREKQMQAMAGVVVVVIDGGEGCSAAAAAKKKARERVVVECRICQEEDEVQAMESPCACSGTLKFAHRKCIQRWCNKKGDINCEICNQVFSPNYSLPPATISPDLVAIDVRRAWGPHINLRDSHLIALAAAERQFLRSDYEEYAVENSSSIACLRSVALVLLIILLLRQALMITRETGMVQESSMFFDFQVSVLQFAGFLLPCYVMARSWYIQSRRRQAFHLLELYQLYGHGKNYRTILLRSKGKHRIADTRDISLEILGPSKVYKQAIENVINPTVAEYVQKSDGPAAMVKRCA